MKNRIRNLAYIESPLQFLCALEYEKHDIEFVIRKNKINKNNEQIIKIIELFDKKNTIKYRNNSSFLVHFNLFLRLLLLSLQYDRILIGDERSGVFKLLHFFVNKKKFVLLDDGIATIHPRYPNQFSRFTCFADTPSSKRNQFFVVKEFLRRNQKKGSHDGLCVIIGTDHIESRLVSFNEYMVFLKQAILDAGLKPVIYLAHRFDTEEKLEKIVKLTGVKIFQNRLPVELIQYELSSNVTEFRGFISSALFTLPLIYQDASFCAYKLVNLASDDYEVERIYAALPKCVKQVSLEQVIN